MFSHSYYPVTKHNPKFLRHLIKESLKTQTPNTDKTKRNTHHREEALESPATSMEKAHATRPQQEKETREERSKEKCNAVATIFQHAQDEAFDRSYMSFVPRKSGVLPCEC